MLDLHKPLQHKRILVTRPKHQSQHLSQLIEQAGAQALLFPVLEIIAPHNIQLAQQTLSETSAWDWIIFTSVNAVNYAIEITNNQLPITTTTRIAAIGIKTANSLVKHGITVDLIPSITSSEGLVSTAEMQLIKHQRCLIIKGEAGRTLLAERLRSQGANITNAEVYRRICPNSDSKWLIQQWNTQAIDYVTITSVEALNNLIQLIGDRGVTLLKTTTLVVLSSRIHDAAICKGLTNVIIATTTSDQSIIETIVQLQKIGLKSTPRVQSN
jgi:uroporphyrinogen-III synthase